MARDAPRLPPPPPGPFGMSGPRLALLGLDGLSLDIARTLAAQGGLPRLASLVADPRVGTLEAELPELSPVNWTSLATAEGPERHGILGFTAIDPRAYALHLLDFRHVRVPTIFDRLTERGRICRVLNLPGTSPARPFQGMLAPGGRARGTLVAGFIAPSLELAVQPPELIAELKAMDYRIEADTLRGAGDPAHLLAELHRTLAGRRRLLERWLVPGDFDLLICVLTETDRLFHFLLPAALEPDAPWHAECRRFLEAWDAVLGLFLDAVAALPGTRLLVMADHGFAPLRVEVDVNAWLRRHGFLHVENRHASPSPLDASGILPQSRALALDPGRIHLHRAGLFARGAATERDAPALLADIAAGLMHLTWEGEPVMDAVLDGRELYPGLGPEDGRPDLVCVPRPGFDCKAKFDRTDVFSRHGRHGAHAWQGAIFLDSLGARPRRPRDVGRLILRHFALESAEPAFTEPLLAKPATAQPLLVAP